MKDLLVIFVILAFVGAGPYLIGIIGRLVGSSKRSSQNGGRAASSEANAVIRRGQKLQNSANRVPRES